MGLATLTRRVVACAACLLACSLPGLGSHDAPTVREARGKGGVHADRLDTRRPGEDIVLRRGKVRMVFAKRLAGAVWHMEYDGHEVIPRLHGNGGSLQTALAFDIHPGESPEIENPTEAGNHRDSFGATTSVWEGAAASDRAVYTRVRMAYYYPPGERVASSPHGTRARGDSPVSEVTLQKRVALGWKGRREVVNWSVLLEWTRPHWFVQIQPLTAYLSADFRRAYVVKDGRATQVDFRSFGVSPPETSHPIILAKTPEVAVGLYCHTAPGQGRFPRPWQPWYTMGEAAGHYDFGSGLERVELTCISAVWHGGSVHDQTDRIERFARFGCAMVLGNVDDVARTIGELSSELAESREGE